MHNACKYFYNKHWIFVVYINLNPLLISHGKTHQYAQTSVGGGVIGIQNDPEYVSDTAATGDSNIVGASTNVVAGGGDDSAIIAPTWRQSAG